MSKLRVKYQTVEIKDIDIHIRILRDNQQFEDIDDIAKKLGISSALWPIFGQVWPSGEVLANFMVDYDIKNKRILEVGCGMALSSLLLNHLGADITSTDYHPSVKEFLDINTKLNADKPIPFERTSWEDTNDTLGEFDLIIVSDLLYESGHFDTLSNFINNHAKKTCEVIIVDPGRGHQNKFTKKMQQLGYEFTQLKPDTTDYLAKEYKGKILKYNKRHL